MFKLRFTIEAHPRWKNGQPPQRTTGVAKSKFDPAARIHGKAQCGKQAHRQTGNHAGHSEHEHGNRERDADPESPRHRDEFRIFFVFDCGRARLESHAADRARAGARSNDFRMHRARVFDSRRWRERNRRFERHATFRASAGMVLRNFGVHRADVIWFLLRGRRSAGGAYTKFERSGCCGGVSCGRWR